MCKFFSGNDGRKETDKTSKATKFHLKKYRLIIRESYA